MQKRIHYGWIIALTCFLMVAISLGLCNSPHGLYQIPITTSTGISRAQFSAISTFRFAATALFNFFFGRLSRKFGLRKLAVFGLASLCAGLTTLSFGSVPAVFLAGGFLLGIGSALSTTATSSALISNWFSAHRGLVLGVVLCASGIGGALFSRLVSGWIARLGWRGSYRVSAAIVLLTAVGALLLLRERPSDKGLAPIGRQSAPETEKPAEKTPSGITLAAALRSPRFYVIMVCSFIVGPLNNPIYVTVPAQMADKGFSAESGAAILSWIFISIAVSKVLLGAIHDRIGLIPTLTVCFASNLIGLTLLLTGTSLTGYYLFALIFGLSVPLENLIHSLVAARVFGRKDFSSFVGIAIALCSIGISIGNYLIGLCYDLTGSYRLYIIVSLILSAAAFAALVLAVRTAPAQEE